MQWIHRAEISNRLEYLVWQATILWHLDRTDGATEHEAVVHDAAEEGMTGRQGSSRRRMAVV